MAMNVRWLDRPFRDLADRCMDSPTGRQERDAGDHRARRYADSRLVVEEL